MGFCLLCKKQVISHHIDEHMKSGCTLFISNTDGDIPSSSAPETPTTRHASPPPPSSSADGTQLPLPSSTQKRSAAEFFSTPRAKRQATDSRVFTRAVNGNETAIKTTGVKRSYDDALGPSSPIPAPMETVDEAMEDGDLPGEQQQQQQQQQKPRPPPLAPTSPGTRRMAKRPKTRAHVPLAERMRPKTLDEVAGQDIVGSQGLLRHLIETDRVPSMILWGASGTGKTTIARCIAEKVKARFIELNATSTGVAEVKKYFAEAATELQLTGRKTVIFCDEIHRFNKSQQDIFLKPVENGTITLIGATTENPSFKVQNALLSRCRVFVLAPLGVGDIWHLLERAIASEKEINPGMTISPLIDEDFLYYISCFADGDARSALNLLELALGITSGPSDPSNPITPETLKQALTKTLVYDRAGDQHYDNISAFHKSVRGSDPDATIYYLARMLQSGEEPTYIARRMVIIASEDVGLADNSLLTLATSTYTACEKIGMPEARIPLAHCAIALALAPKSVKAYRALNSALHAMMEPGVAALPIPLHLRNAPTRLMKEQGYGDSYKYNPNYKDGKVRQTYLPEDLLGRRFFEGGDLGVEVDEDLEDEEEDEEGDENKEKGREEEVEKQEERNAEEGKEGKEGMAEGIPDKEEVDGQEEIRARSQTVEPALAVSQQKAKERPVENEPVEKDMTADVIPTRETSETVEAESEKEGPVKIEEEL